MRILFILLIFTLSSAANAAEDLISSLRLPAGFQVQVYQDNIPGARSLSLGNEGTIFIGTRSEGKVYALRDGRLHTIVKGLKDANGVFFHKGSLYVAEIEKIHRYDNIEKNLERPPKPILLTDSLPKDTHHGWRFIAVGPDQKLYVSIGAPCNICERQDPRYASIMRLDLDGKNPQVWASGIRNSVGFDWDPRTGDLWFTDNGRDWMGDDLPVCELNHLTKSGQHFGYPYCHGGETPDPEFGKERKCDEFASPVVKIPAHSSPLGMRFYRGKMFPKQFNRGVFIAEHGSWNRSKPIGYRVSFVRLDADGKVLSYEAFLEGFLTSSGTTTGRPVDVLNLPDGSLLVSDDQGDRLYRITYKSASK